MLQLLVDETHSFPSFCIPSLFILDFNVEGGILSISAAPPGPHTLPWHFRSTSMM
jgi:hypothetical protein